MPATASPGSSATCSRRPSSCPSADAVPVGDAEVEVSEDAESADPAAGFVLADTQPLLDGVVLGAVTPAVAPAPPAPDAAVPAVAVTAPQAPLPVAAGQSEDEGTAPVPVTEDAVIEVDLPEAKKPPAGPSCVVPPPDEAVPAKPADPAPVDTPAPAGDDAAQAAAPTAPAASGDQSADDKPRHGGENATAPAQPAAQAAPVKGAHVHQVHELPLQADQTRFEKLVDSLDVRLRVSASQGGRDIRMTLRPAELGEVTVRLQLNHGVAVATLFADRHEAAALLAQAAGDLRSALADRGLHIERLEVSTGLGDDRSTGGSRDPQRGGQPHRETLYRFAAAPAAGVAAAAQHHQAAVPHGEGLWLLA